MRSIWKGSIAFGLVNVPVKVYSATQDHDIKFHQVHAKDNGRIRYKRVCEVCGEVVEYGDLTRAYESDDGQMVIITDDDIATLPEERSREIEVLEFVPASEVDPMMFDRSYFLEPDSKSSKSYVLLAKTLAETDRMAIVHFSVRNKTRLAALRVKDFGKRDVMVVHTLLWPDEIRDPDFPVLDKKVDIKPAELKMAGRRLPGAAAGADRRETRRWGSLYHRGATEGAGRDRRRLRPARQAGGQREGALGRREVSGEKGAPQKGCSQEGSCEEGARQEGRGNGGVEVLTAGRAAASCIPLARSSP